MKIKTKTLNWYAFNIYTGSRGINDTDYSISQSDDGSWKLEVYNERGGYDCSHHLTKEDAMKVAEDDNKEAVEEFIKKWLVI